MDNSNRNSQKQVTLQELLRVKRLEKPGEAFWMKFDQELSDRTLKKLVYKHSIFSQVIHVFSMVLKPLFPLGVLSLLTLGIFSYSYFPKLFQSHSIRHVAISYEKENLMDLSSAKKNYVKANIVMDLPENSINSNILEYPSASGVRYLAGSLNSHVLSHGITTNTIY